MTELKIKSKNFLLHRVEEKKLDLSTLKNITGD